MSKKDLGEKQIVKTITHFQKALLDSDYDKTYEGLKALGARTKNIETALAIKRLMKTYNVSTRIDILINIAHLITSGNLDFMWGYLSQYKNNYPIFLQLYTWIKQIYVNSSPEKAYEMMQILVSSEKCYYDKAHRLT